MAVPRHHNALSHEGASAAPGLAVAATAAANGQIKQAPVTAFSATQGAQALVDARMVGGPLAEAYRAAGVICWEG